MNACILLSFLILQTLYNKKKQEKVEYISKVAHKKGIFLNSV